MKERDRFKNEEEIKHLYEKIEHEFEAQIITHLRKQEILPEDRKYDITPDFDNMEKWRISTILHKDYTQEGILSIKEDIKRIKGIFCITKGALKIYPSFNFEFETAGSKFSFNKGLVEKIIADDKQKEDWSVYSLLGETGRNMTVMDRERDQQREKLKKETIPMLKGIGFSEDEAGLMVVGAMKSGKFTDDMDSSGLISLALKTRGQSLTSKD